MPDWAGWATGAGAEPCGLRSIGPRCGAQVWVNSAGVCQPRREWGAQYCSLCARLPEPCRVFRRLPLLSKVEHDEQDNEQVSPEVRERAVRLVLDNEGQHGSRWQAVISISAKIGCAPQTLNDRVRKAEVDSGKRPGVSSGMAERMRALERENRELRQANEILRKGEPVKAPLVQAHWRTRILRWRSSTAGRSDGQVHR